MSYSSKLSCVLMVFLSLFLIAGVSIASDDEVCPETVTISCDGEKTLEPYRYNYYDRCEWHNTFQYDWGSEEFYLYWCESGGCGNVAYDYDGNFEAPYWVLVMARYDNTEGNRYASYVGEHYDVEGTFELDQGCTHICDGYWEWTTDECYGEWVERCYGDPICGESLEATVPPSDAIPDIKANGEDGPLKISAGNALVIEVSLEPMDLSDQNADWWIWAQTPFGQYYYDAIGTPKSWKQGTSVTYQSSLYNLQPTKILDRNLPKGLYTFYFEVDMNMDGIKDMEIITDSVEVIVE